MLFYFLLYFLNIFFSWVKETIIDKDCRKSNTLIFFREINFRVLLLKQIPFIIGIAKEYENLTIYGNEEKILTKAYLHYKDCMRPYKLDSVSPSNKKAICILYSYINRKPLDTTNYKNNLENVLSYSNLIVEFLEQLCYELNGYQHYKIINEFSQNLHQ